MGVPCGALNEGLHLLQTAGIALVDRIGKALEVNVEGIHIGQDLLQRFLAGGAIGDDHHLQAVLFCELRGIPYVFPADHGFVVCEGDADIARRDILLRFLDELFGAHIEGTSMEIFL